MRFPVVLLKIVTIVQRKLYWGAANTTHTPAAKNSSQPQQRAGVHGIEGEGSV